MATLFRVATVEDAEIVAGIYVASRQEHYRGIMPDAYLDGLSLEKATRSWEGWINVNSGTVLTVILVEEAGVAVGFAAYRGLKQEEGYSSEIVDQRALYVHPTHMKRGFGRALVEEVQRRAREEGYVELVLWALADNTKSCAFYEHMGFERVEGASTIWQSDGHDPFRLEEIQYRMVL